MDNIMSTPVKIYRDKELLIQIQETDFECRAAYIDFLCVCSARGFTLLKEDEKVEVKKEL